MTVRCLAVLVHCQTSLTNRIAGGDPFHVLRVALIQGNNRFSVVDIPNQIVDCLDVIAFICKKSAFLQRKGLVCCFQNQLNDIGISNICRRSQFIEGQAGDTVHQNVAFISPIEFIILLIVLIGCRVNTECAIRVAGRMVFFAEFILLEGLWIVLCGIGHDWRGVQTNKGRIYNTKLVKPLHQSGHDIFQIAVFNAFKESGVRPIRRQRLHDVKAAEVCDNAVVFQKVCKICDLIEALAFHDDKGTKHCFLGKTFTPCICVGKLKVQYAEQLVIKIYNALGCKQTYILYQFLSVDSGQPLSGWFCR